MDLQCAACDLVDCAICESSLGRQDFIWTVTIIDGASYNFCKNCHGFYDTSEVEDIDTFVREARADYKSIRSDGV